VGRGVPRTEIREFAEGVNVANSRQASNETEVDGNTSELKFRANRDAACIGVGPHARQREAGKQQELQLAMGMPQPLSNAEYPERRYHRRWQENLKPT
jgi:hypothetical protein